MSITASHSQYLFIRALAFKHNLYNKRKNTKTLYASPSLRALCFILDAYCNQFYHNMRKNDGWLPLSADMLRRYFRGWDWEELQDKGLLIVDDTFSIRGKKSMRYKPHPSLLDGFLAATDFESENPRFVDILTGREWPDLPSIPDEELNPAKIVQDAISILKISFYNHSAVVKHLQSQKQQLDNAQTDSKGYETLAARWRNDASCFSAIRKYGNPSVPNENGICSFSPKYRPQRTGRIGIIGGGFQSCSREMKLAAFGTLEEMHNYDLSSSQVRICLEEFKRQNIECPWLVDYLENRDRRLEYAAQVGISKDTWKQCLSSLLMGAPLPTNTSKYNDGSILDALSLEFTEKEELAKALKQFRLMVKPLMKPLDKWHQRLIEQAQSQGYAENAVGHRREFGEFRYPKGEIAAHILQGAEALFIHHLTLLGSKYRFQPIQNEHDGLITIGKIPNKAIEKAKTLAGFNYFQLVEKQDFDIGSNI